MWRGLTIATVALSSLRRLLPVCGGGNRGHAGVPADDTLSLPVRVAVFNGDGTPDPGAGVSITSTAGTVGAARHEGDGIYDSLVILDRFRWVPYAPPVGTLPKD